MRPRHRRTYLSWLPALALLLALSSLTARARGAAVQVNITNYYFRPDPLTIEVGDTVTWTNRDNPAHTATADDGAFASPYLLQGQSYSHTFTRPGIYTYFCVPHTYMRGTITVQAERFLFPETGKTVQGRFLAYWIAHGDLTLNGFPLSDERTETLEDGRVYLVQYFEVTFRLFG